MRRTLAPAAASHPHRAIPILGRRTPSSHPQPTLGARPFMTTPSTTTGGNGPKDLSAPARYQRDKLSHAGAPYACPHVNVCTCGQQARTSEGPPCMSAPHLLARTPAFTATRLRQRTSSARLQPVRSQPPRIPQARSHSIAHRRPPSDRAAGTKAARLSFTRGMGQLRPHVNDAALLLLISTRCTPTVVLLRSHPAALARMPPCANASRMLHLLVFATTSAGNHPHSRIPAKYPRSHLPPSLALALRRAPQVDHQNDMCLVSELLGHVRIRLLIRR